MMRHPVLAVLLLGLAGACSGPVEPPASDPTALVRTVVASPAALSDTLQAYGRIEFNPAEGETLTAPIEARVTAVYVTVGQTVARGAPVAALQPTPAARIGIDQAARDAAVAEAEYRRLERLRADGLAADNDVAAARAAAATASETSRSLRARAGTPLLRAGRAGAVDALPVTVGDVVPVGGPVARIGGLGSMRARLGVEARSAGAIGPGMAVTLSGLGPDGGAYTGRVLSVDRRIDPDTRLAGVLVALPGQAGFLPGQAVKGEIVLGQRTAGVTLPHEALLYDGDRPFIYVAAANKAARRDVRLGVDRGGQVEVLEGVAAGERVVIEGGSVLEPGMALREDAPAAAKAQ